MTALADAITAREAELTTARDLALEEVQAKPTCANRKTYRQACKALEDFLKAKAQPDTGEESYTGIDEVLTWLQGDGWKISRSTLYEHRDQGKLRANQDGMYPVSRVQEYAHRHLRKLDGTSGSEVEDLQQRKTEAEVRRILSDAELRELKLRTALGELIPRSQVEIELAERAGNLKNYLNAVARSSAGRVIKLVGGDPQKAPELISWWLAMNKKAMDNYSRPILGLEDEEE